VATLKVGVQGVDLAVFKLIAKVMGAETVEAIVTVS